MSTKHGPLNKIFLDTVSLPIEEKIGILKTLNQQPRPTRFFEDNLYDEEAKKPKFRLIRASSQIILQDKANTKKRIIFRGEEFAQFISETKIHNGLIQMSDKNGRCHQTGFSLHDLILSKHGLRHHFCFTFLGTK